MNIIYLLEHISEQLHTIVRQIRYDEDKYTTICKRIDFHDDFDSNFNLMSFSNTVFKLPKIILLDYACYCIISSADCNFVIGPIKLQYTAINGTLFEDNLYLCDVNTLLSHLLLLYNLTNTIPINKNDILDYNFSVDDLQNKIKKKYTKTLYDNLENNFRHNSHYKEVRELNSIKNGDIESLMKSWDEDLAGVHGILAKDSERQLKNLAITSLILASRAAIDGGLHPEISYTIVDKYVYELEELKDLNKIIPLVRKAEIDYTELVRDLKMTKPAEMAKHPMVEQAKDYILRNIYKTLTIKTISNDLGFNGNYLAKIFFKQENISIPNYILKEKINLAKNMLTYSNATYISISVDLGFSSQSFFTKKFSELTGTTPKKYRDMYGIKNYV